MKNGNDLKKYFWRRVYHKLFNCPTFWRIKPAFKCPGCGKKYRCYWEGNDTQFGINYCDSCDKILNRLVVSGAKNG